MLGIKIKSGAVKRIEDIAFAKTIGRKIPVSAFNDIRNKKLVRSTLINLGYTPNSTASPTFWFKQKIISESAFLSARDAVANYAEVKPRQSSSVAEQVRQKALAGELIYPDKFSISRRQVMRTILSIRQEGFTVLMTCYPSKTRAQYYQVVLKNQA